MAGERRHRRAGSVGYEDVRMTYAYHPRRGRRSRLIRPTCSWTTWTRQDPAGHSRMQSSDHFERTLREPGIDVEWAKATSTDLTIVEGEP